MEKKKIESKIKAIASLYRSDKDFDELDFIKTRYKVSRTMGITTLWASEKPITNIVKFCRRYVAENGNGIDLIVLATELGHELTTKQKIKLAEYHTALTYLLAS